MSGVQLGLFEKPATVAAAPVIDTSFATAVRTQLDETSWVEHVPGWLAGSDQLFAELVSLAGWEQRSRWMFHRMVIEPRLTAEVPDVRASPIVLLVDIAAALSHRYGVDYDGLWINQYRDHDDSTSWHADWPSCQRDLCIVPVLSLGARRRFLLRARSGGRSHGFLPDGGDLIVMGGRCQRDWVHCVPKQKAAAGTRVSVNFKSSWQATPEPRAEASARRGPSRAMSRSAP
jgi:alkylated DNA repair dioxygenase AlkB